MTLNYKKGKRNYFTDNLFRLAICQIVKTVKMMVKRCSSNLAIYLNSSFRLSSIVKEILFIV